MVDPARDANNNYSQLGPQAAIRSSQVTLQVQFKGLTGLDTNPANPSFRMIDPETGESVSIDALGAVQAANGTYLPESLGSGLYSLSFLTTGLKQAIYEVEWSGEYTDPTDLRVHTRIIKGTLGIGEISLVQDYINRVTYRLMDDHPEEYRIDEPTKWWRPSQIYQYLRDSIGRFNSIGPRFTTCTIDTFPQAVDELLVTGAVIWALRARARLEIANTMQYTDGHTLNIDRSPKLMQLADTLYREWEASIKDFKKATPPTPMGIRSQRVPFRIFRVIGMLPNYSSYFSS